MDLSYLWKNIEQGYLRMVLRRIFGPKGESGGRLEKLHNLYTSPNIIRAFKSRRMRWVGYVAHMIEMRNVYKILVRKPEGKRPHGSSRCRWEDNNTVDLRVIGWEVVDWMHLAQDRE